MAEDLKRAAAEEAVEKYVRSDTVVGLGTGSTASYAVRRIGGLIAAGELHGVRGVPTSARTAALAREMDIPLLALSEASPVLTIDGADEIDPNLSLIKGLGGALLREKIVAHASSEGLVVVADGSKVVDSLGKARLPVEIEPFGHEVTLAALASLGCEPTLRLEGSGSQTGDPNRPYVTDGGHYTADCLFPDGIPDPGALETEIKRIPGALETGLFVGLVLCAVVARPGGTEVMETP